MLHLFLFKILIPRNFINGKFYVFILTTLIYFHVSISFQFGEIYKRENESFTEGHRYVVTWSIMIIDGCKFDDFFFFMYYICS